MKKIVSFIFLLFVCGGVAGQSDIRFFSGKKDTGRLVMVPEAITENEFIYLGGSPYIDYDYNNNPLTVIKADTSGRVYWTFKPLMEIYSDSVPDAMHHAYVRVEKLLLDERNIYVLANTPGAGMYSIIALDKSTGNITWRSEFEYAGQLFQFAGPIGNWLVVRNTTEYKLINKETGAVELEKTLPYNDVMEVAADGTVYFARKDTLEQYSNPRLEQRVWVSQAFTEKDNPNWPQSWDGNVTQIIQSEDGYVYFAGKINNRRPFIGRSKKSDGTRDWFKRSNGDDVGDPFKPSRMIVWGDYIYTVFSEAYSGGSNFYYEALKLNKNTGATIWNVVQDGKWPWEWPNERKSCALDWCDVDENGNLYVTGRQEWNTNSHWVIAKIDPYGKLMYYNTLREGLPLTNERGIMVQVMKNRVMYLGNMVDTTNLLAAVVMTDTSGIFKPDVRPLDIVFEEPGTIKGITPYSAEKYAVYSQEGNRARLQLRNTKDNSIIWTRYVEKVYPLYPGNVWPEIVYCEADRICITKDNSVGITALMYRSGTKMFQRDSRPDSLIYLKFDSLGNRLFTNSIHTGWLKKFKSLQLFPANSYTALVAEGREYPNWDSGPVQYMIMNLHKPNELYDPVPFTGINTHSAYGSLQLLVPYVRDSALSAYSWSWGPERVYEVIPYFFTEEPGPWNDNKFWYKYGAFRRIFNANAEWKNLSSIDSVNILILGSDLTNGRYSAMRYNVKDERVLWVYNADEGVALHNASTDNKSTYFMGNEGGDLVAIKINNVNGVQIWKKKVQPPRPGLIYCTIEQRVNNQLQQYTVCGYLKDTLRELPRQWPFYIVFDAAGDIVQRWEQEPYFDGKSQLNMVMVNQLGQTVIGGSYYKKEEGRAGVLITANAPVPAVKNITKDICIAGNITLAAGIAGNIYQWQEDDGLGFRDLQETTNFQGVQSAALRIANISADKQKNRYRCMAEGKSGPWYTLETAASLSVTISGDTLVKAATPATLTANTLYAGDQPLYTWEDSSSLHTWKTIPGSNSRTITYTPSAMKTKLRCAVTGSLECASGESVLSPVFTMNVDPVTAVTPVPTETFGINVYPNPVVSELVLDSLRMSDQWHSLEIRQLNGVTVFTRTIANQTRIIVPAGALRPGMYFVILRGKNGQVARHRFIKL